jgi:hypothetical protein
VRSFPADFDRWAFALTNIAAFPVAKLIGSIRRECLDHDVVLGERHLRHILLSYMQSFNEVRTHLSLNKDVRARCPIQSGGYILCRPILGGLHHQYVRI